MEYLVGFSECLSPDNGYSQKIAKRSNFATLYDAGADERNRTVDLLITNELLYQLSYIGISWDYIRAVLRLLASVLF